MGALLLRVMPSQAAKTIEELFPHVASGRSDAILAASHSAALRGIVELIDDIPDELLVCSEEAYANFILAKSTIVELLERWKARGDVGTMPPVKGVDAVTVVWRVLRACPDEHPPSPSTELMFITDIDLRESIRRDVGAAHRALQNAEWKAATVLAGGTIEALLHWRLSRETPAVRAAAASAVVGAGRGLSRPPSTDLNQWVLNEFILVASQLGAIKPDTANAALLAKDFRNLIHPGRAIRLNQVCDRGTSHMAIGALERVIVDIS